MSIGTYGGKKLWNVKVSQIGYNATKNFTFGKNSFAEFDYTLGFTAITTRNATLVKEIIDYMNETFYPYKEDGTFIMPAQPVEGGTLYVPQYYKTNCNYLDDDIKNFQLAFDFAGFKRLHLNMSTYIEG